MEVKPPCDSDVGTM